MKKILLAALFAAAPLTAFAGSAAELSDTDLGAVSGQAGLQLTAAQTQQIITGLQQTAGVLNAISPILPSQGKSVVTIVNSAAKLAPVVNNLVNGAKPTTGDIVTIVTNGAAAGVAIGKLASGL